MSAPEPMLSTRGARWPTCEDWVLQAKWDGFRLLVEIPRAGAVRAWSRHGASLGERVPQILEPFGEMPAGTIVDGELVALGELGGRPVQDFASVRRAVLTGDAQAGGRLRFVAFDLLMVGGSDVRARPWFERDEQLRRWVPGCEVVRVIESGPVSRERHDAIVSLGFEGTVIKRRRSSYRAGRQSSWRKQKARQEAVGLALEVREDRHGSRWVVCNVDGRRVIASAAGVDADVIGRSVRIVYSRTDADGSLREARIDRRLSGTSDGGCGARAATRH